MYTLLGYLPELLLPSKTPIARYVKEHIFEPLGMNSTTYSYEVASATGNLADGMTRQGVNFTANPFGNGTVRAKPFWSQVGGEDGNSVYQLFVRPLRDAHQIVDSGFRSRRYHQQRYRHGKRLDILYLIVSHV